MNNKNSLNKIWYMKKFKYDNLNSQKKPYSLQRPVLPLAEPPEKPGTHNRFAYSEEKGITHNILALFQTKLREK